MPVVLSLLAQADAAPKGGEPAWFQPLMLGLIAFSFIMFIILPMRRERRARLEMMSAVDKGSRVVVNGAIVGTVDRVEKADEKNPEATLLVRIDDNANVKLRVLLSSVTRVLSKDKKDPKDGA
jgi:preprotein translocase subunit YajC